VLRVVPRGFRASDAPKLSKADPKGLAAALRSDNLLWRLHAQRMLVESGSRDAVARLVELASAPGQDELGLNVGAIHALQALEQLHALERPEVRACVAAALRHESGAARRTALEVLPSDVQGTAQILGAKLLDDADDRTKLAALLALARMPPSAEAGRAVAAIALDERLTRDRVLADGAMCAAATHAAGFLEAVLESGVARAANAATASPAQLLPNPGFEELARANRPVGWLVRHYSGEAEHRVVPLGRSGQALEMSSTSGADTSYYATAQLDPDATYRLSGWIKTRDLDASRAYGACLNVHEIQGETNACTPSVSGTSDWKRVEVVFEAGGRSEVTINCLFGGWGWARGTAWFDDVRLELVGSPGLSGPTGRIVSRVTRHFAHHGRPAEALELVARLPQATEALATSILAGLAEVPALERAPQLDAAALVRADAAARELAQGPRELLAILLVERWKLRERFAGLASEVERALEARLADETADSASRALAARRRIALDDSSEGLEALLASLTLDTDADLAQGVVEALAESRRADLGERLVAKWSQLSPAAQRAASYALRRRALWTRALLTAIERGELPASVFDPAAWQELERHPERDLAELASRVRRKGAPELALDLAAITTRVASLRGDRERGRELFSKNCAVCHTLGGEGGPVGPALDGVGTRATDELLVAMLDPSRSVEANFQLWVARTFDERVFSGRLVAETRTTIELLDSQAAPHVLERAEVESITPSSLSLMPSGFESLGEQGLADLLALLRDPPKAK
jgi:putative heme-binding domain-containing protein